MNVASWLVWGLAATTLMTSLMAASQGLGLTRINLPYILGTMFTPDRDRARALGVVIHLVNGWITSLAYVGVFEQWPPATWWKGALVGLAHAAFVLTVALPALPGLHPRMATERRGPTVVRQLEPPGFLGLHYGIQTPIWIAAGHVVFGIVLGGFYARA
ncbi:MAG TPA: hypothetical protein VHE35_11970 [Kofleriaceae bacterium]|nr:hypothetical protein [Kofleriaceae bacterium]